MSDKNIPSMNPLDTLKEVAGVMNAPKDYIIDQSVNQMAQGFHQDPNQPEFGVAKDAINFITPDVLGGSAGHLLGAAQGAGKVATTAEKIAANPEAQAAIKKLIEAGQAPSAAIAAAFNKATGKIIPVLSKDIGYAEGGEIADFDPDAFLASLPPTEPSLIPGAPPVNLTNAQGIHGTEEFDPDEFLRGAHAEKYGTPEQMLKAGAEGVAHGIAGPLATFAEKHVLGVKDEDIRGRQEENPIIHGAGQAAGLGLGLLTGTGEAALMTKAGEVAMEAANLGKALETASLGYKVGSSAVQQAAEMAVLSGGDEVSKMLLNDPNTSAQSAIANVGLSAALGGLGGAFITGAVNPLWNATAGPHVENLLGSLKNHLDGAKLLLPEQAENALQKLGIEVDAVTRAGLSGDTRAAESYKILREGQHPQILGGLEKMQQDASESVAKSLGVMPEEVAVRSEKVAGDELLDTFKREYNDKYAPIAEAMEKRNTEAAKITIADAARLDEFGKMLEAGMQKVGTDSAAYKLYNDYGQRLLAKETIGSVDMLKTEINNDIQKALRAGDNNTMFALRDIRDRLADFQERQIIKQANSLGAKELGSQLLNERADANRSYKEFASMSSDLMDHLGVGQFHGAKTLTNKLTDKISAEQLLNKFSIKGDVAFIPFLEKNFPEVLNKVKENELKRFLKPAVMQAKGEQPLNVNKLHDLISKTMAGEKEYVESLFSPEALQKIQAAKSLQDAIPTHKSSGTAGWMTKMFKNMPSSGLAAVSMVTGHNPIFGGILGETAQRLGRDAPDAIRLGYLKFLASDQPIKAEGFKAMVDFMDRTYKGENMLAKASKAVFKSGAQVLSETNIPGEKDRERLDKIITKAQEQPSLLTNKEQGHLGHYMPTHQTAVTEASLSAVKYLESIKPKPVPTGPLDKPIEPTPGQVARYNRALDIAQQPAIVLEHIKNGSLQATDVTDLNAMYPGVYKQLSDKLSLEMIGAQSKGIAVPYQTRLGLSLFLGTPVDATMTPQAIMAAQPKPQGAPQPPSQPKKPSDKAGTMMNKGAMSYQTPTQQAEHDRSSRK